MTWAFQGASSAQKIIVIEYEDESAKPEFQPYAIQNNDKLFESTERSVEARIIKGFSVPKELINSEKTSGLSNGSEKKQAISEFNDNTTPDRQEISDAFRDIFGHFYINLNNNDNWAIVSVPASVAEETIGVKAGSNLNQLLQLTIPVKNKIATLVHAYGFTEAEAEAMCA